MSERDVMVSRLAGRWYEADGTALAREIDQYLTAQGGPQRPGIGAVIVPHAGYAYSAPVAAAALSRISAAEVRRVIALGPTHCVPMPDGVSVPDAGSVRTPLGDVTIDRAIVDQLRQEPMVLCEPRAHEEEHSVQIQLPLLQRVLGEAFTFVPVVVGQLDVGSMRRLARVIRPLLDAETLVVVSSDFTHYGRHFGYMPFGAGNVLDRIEQLDRRLFAHLTALDLEQFWYEIETTGATVCGRCAIGVLMALLPAGTRIEECAYDMSGRMTGDGDSSVSYLSATAEVNWDDREE